MGRVAPLRANGLVRPALCLLTLALAALGCQPQDTRVAPCTVTEFDDGAVLVRCPDGTEQTVEPVAAGLGEASSPLPSVDRVIDGPEALAAFNARPSRRLPGRLTLRGPLPEVVTLRHLTDLGALVLDHPTGLTRLSLPDLAHVATLQVQGAPALQALDLPALAALDRLVVVGAPWLEALRLPSVTALDSVTLEVTSGALLSLPGATRIGRVSLLGGAWRGSPHHLRLGAVTAMPEGLDLRAAGPVTLDLSALRSAGSLTLQGAPHTVIEAPALASVGGDVLVLTPGLTLALPALETLDGTLSLVAGAVDLPALRALGRLVVDGPGFSALALPALAAVRSQVLLRSTALVAFALPALRRLGDATPHPGPRLDVLGNANLRALSLPAEAVVGPTLEAPQLRVAGNYDLCGAAITLPEAAELVFDETARCRP